MRRESMERSSKRTSGSDWWIFLAVLLLVGAHGCKPQDAEPPQESANSELGPKDGLEKAEKAEERPRSFESPDAAVEALVGAVEANDMAALEAIFGPGGEPLVEWGVPVADMHDRVTFLKLYRAKHALVDGEEGQKLLQIGPNDWPLPAPLVEREGRWFFDGAAGADELVYRRIGANELGAIRVTYGFVDAQYEYASKRRDGNMAGLFAAYLISDPGRQNGLYWPTEGNEPPSPAGPFVAAAAGEGYRRAASGEPQAYHGYFYRMLYAQGEASKGGAKVYLQAGRLVDGFGVIAWPAEYDVRGVKTFVVNQDGVVYEKDLGAETPTLVEDIDRFDPDDGWHPVELPPELED